MTAKHLFLGNPFTRYASPSGFPSKIFFKSLVFAAETLRALFCSSTFAAPSFEIFPIFVELGERMKYIDDVIHTELIPQNEMIS